jgi:hypothetical protein
MIEDDEVNKSDTMVNDNLQVEVKDKEEEHHE